VSSWTRDFSRRLRGAAGCEHRRFGTCGPVVSIRLATGDEGEEEEEEEAYIQRLDALVKARFDALSHQTTSTAATKVMLHTLLAEAVFLCHRAVSLQARP
jgi:hypothetical protein